MSYKFRGGVHPKPNKELSADKPFETLLPKGEMVYPISQHIGKPARPVVKRGDEVLAGQLIAEADGFVSANIYATVSGKVKAIEHRRTSAGVPADCIVVTNDGQYNTAAGIGEECDPDTLTNSEIIDRIKMAGIVGLGGAGFPTHVKLSPRNPEEIRWIIANGAECEPGITCDDRLMRERPEWVIEGMRCVLRLFDKAKGIIAIEENKPEAIEAIEEALEGDDRISVMTLQVRYPQGSERNLVHAATGMYMESGALPASLGCIVDNVWTLAAIYRAVCFNEPLMEKGFTVTGEGAVNPGNFLIRIGTSVSEVLGRRHHRRHQKDSAGRPYDGHGHSRDGCSPGQGQQRPLLHDRGRSGDRGRPADQLHPLRQMYPFLPSGPVSPADAAGGRKERPGPLYRPAWSRLYPVRLLYIYMSGPQASGSCI